MTILQNSGLQTDCCYRLTSQTGNPGEFSDEDTIRIIPYIWRNGELETSVNQHWDMDADGTNSIISFALISSNMKWQFILIIRKWSRPTTGFQIGNLTDRKKIRIHEFQVGKPLRLLLNRQKPA